MLFEKDVKDNYYARFHTHSYECCREIHFNSRLLSFDKVNGTIRSRATGIVHA